MVFFIAKSTTRFTSQWEYDNVESQDNFIIELSGLDADEKAKFHQDFILKGVDMQIEPESIV